jgi:hypothetical protein
VIESAQNQLPAGANQGANRRRARRQHATGQVGEHQIRGAGRIAPEIQHLKRDRVGQRVHARAGFGGIDRVLVDVDADHATRTHQRGGHRQHAGAGAEVEHGRIGDVDLRQQAQAHSRRGVVSRAESHRRLDHDHRAITTLGRQIPRRRDDESAGVHGLQRRLRTGGPVFVGKVHGFDSEPRQRHANRLGGAIALIGIRKANVPMERRWRRIRDGRIRRIPQATRRKRALRQILDSDR